MKLENIMKSIQAINFLFDAWGALGVVREVDTLLEAILVALVLEASVLKAWEVELVFSLLLKQSYYTPFHFYLLRYESFDLF